MPLRFHVVADTLHGREPLLKSASDLPRPRQRRPREKPDILQALADLIRAQVVRPLKRDGVRARAERTLDRAVHVLDFQRDSLDHRR